MMRRDHTALSAKSADRVSVGQDGVGAPCIYFIDLAEYPFDFGRALVGLSSSVVIVTIGDWDNTLTPWPAQGLYRGDADFQGLAGNTLHTLLHEVIPAVEQSAGLRPVSRAIGGYSLGGLFSLYAFSQSTVFRGCASLSGSVWYERWPDFLREQNIADVDPETGLRRCAFLSLGTKEKHAAPEILHCVEDRTFETARILEERGVKVRVELGPGGHHHHVAARIEFGLGALDELLTR